MSDQTPIEWTDATWNPTVGCSLVSPGCTNCYAMRLARTAWRCQGLTEMRKAGAVWTGAVRLDESALDQPLRWKKPKRIFVNSMSDLFHESLPDEAIDRVFAIMALARRHTFQVLTKRAARMRDYFAQGRVSALHMARVASHPCGASGPLCEFLEVISLPLPNVWLGVSVEDQARAEERIPLLLQAPAAVRFLSIEPLLGLVDISEWLWGRADPCSDCPMDLDCDCGFSTRKANGEAAIDWVIVGGESGPDARPMHPDWARSTREQCAAAGVPFFFKQCGAWLPDTLEDNCFKYPRAAGVMMRIDGTRPSQADMPALMNGTFDFTGYQHFSRVGKKAAGALLDGREHREFPK